MTPNERKPMTADELAAAVERLRQRSTPARADAMRHDLRGLGIDPDSLASLTKPDEIEGDNNGKND